MENEKNKILEARDLVKTYGTGEGAVHALSSVSLDIYDGEMLAILGSSGSGKSTLLNMLGGMDKPDAGSILVDGHDLTRYKDRDLTRYRKKEVGFVFQSFNLIAELTVRENVEMTADKSAGKYVSDQALATVGLSHKAGSYPTQLSGGEQQRVSIARALAKNPRLLLCDEPTGALDYETGKQILSELDKLVREQGRTVVIVTHTQEIGKMAHRVIRMRNGKITSEETNETRLTIEEIEW